MFTTYNPHHLADAIEVADAIISANAGHPEGGRLIESGRVSDHYGLRDGRDGYAVTITLTSGAELVLEQRPEGVTLYVAGNPDYSVTPTRHRMAMSVRDAVLPLEVLARLIVQVWEADENSGDDDESGVWA